MSSSQKPKAANSKLEDKKYCSSKCRSQKPSAKDLGIEQAFTQLLMGNTRFGNQPISEALLSDRTKPLKGDPRVVIPCSVVVELVFGSSHGTAKTAGRKKKRASRAMEESQEADDQGRDLLQLEDQAFAGKVRPPQHLTNVNGSVGGEEGRAEEGQESEDAVVRRKEGMKAAEEKERVKRAARRGVVFGFVVEGLDGEDGSHARRKCEAVMKGQVVEPSFAKGDWGIRWRE